METKISDLVLEIIREHYSKTNEGLIQKDIVIEVTKRRGESYQEKNYQPNVSHALERLQKKCKVTLTSSRTYVPYQDGHSRVHLKEELCKTIVFTSSEVFSVSENTLLLCVDLNYIHQATQLLQEYLGADHCFKVTYFNGLTAVFLKGDTETLKSIHQDLESIAKEAIAYHQRTSMKKLTLSKASNT